MTFALGLLESNRNDWHISHRIITFNVSIHRLVDQIRSRVIALMSNIWTSLVVRGLSLLEQTRLLVAEHGFIEI